MDRRIDGRMDWWINKYKDVKMVRQTKGWLYGYARLIDRRWMDRRKNRFIREWIGGRKEGWMIRQMNTRTPLNG